jgi:Fur family ferric uptake transcriptional regulator
MRKKTTSFPELTLRPRGYRATPIWTAILGQFTHRKIPLSAIDIKNVLRREGFPVNKTTVYRKLSSLKKTGVIREIILGDRTRRYEMADGDHHHHLVCVRCKNVEDVPLKEDLDDEEHRIGRFRGFKVLNHSLEFFGVCAKCK